MWKWPNLLTFLGLLLCTLESSAEDLCSSLISDSEIIDIPAFRKGSIEEHRRKVRAEVCADPKVQTLQARATSAQQSLEISRERDAQLLQSMNEVGMLVDLHLAQLKAIQRPWNELLKETNVKDSLDLLRKKRFLQRQVEAMHSQARLLQERVENRLAPYDATEHTLRPTLLLRRHVQLIRKALVRMRGM